MYPLSIPNHRKFFYSISHFHKDASEFEAFVEKSFSSDMHMQDFFEINIISSGEGMHYIENQRYPARVGDVFIVPPLVKHGYRGTEDFDVIHLLYHPNYFERNRDLLIQLPSFLTLFNIEPVLRMHGARAINLKISESELRDIIKRYIEPLCEIGMSKNPRDKLRAQSYATDFIIRSCEIYERQEQPKVIDNFIKSIMYMHIEYRNKITVEQLARMSGMSRTVYFSKFKNTFGTTPQAFLMAIRLEAVKNKLLTTALSLEEIAVGTGFHDAAHLSRFFKKAYGETPAQFRKKHLV